MKLQSKPIFLLLGLVLVIYTMRQNDLSISKGLRGSFKRILQSTGRPSAELCTGISLSESFSEGDMKRAQGFMDNLRSQRGGNPLVDLLSSGNKLSGDEAKDYGMPLIKYLAPWLVFLVFSFVLCIGFYVNWCCMFGCCKKVKCCKCCKLPREPKRIKLYMGITGFFLLGMVGASIAGTIFSSKVSKGMEVTYCSALNLVENLVYGKTEEQWLGMTGIVDRINKILIDYDNALATLQDIGDPATLDPTYNAALAELNTFYNKWSTDPSGTVAAPNNINTPETYKPEYIQNLGPRDTDDTYTNYIKKEIEIWRSTIDTAQDSINTALNTLQDNSGDIKGAMTTGVTTANDIITSVNDVIETLTDSGKTIMNVFKGTGYGIMGIFIANLVLAIFAIVSMILTGILKIKFFNKLLHLNWCIVIILTIFCWLLSSFFLPSSIVMLEACGVIDLALNDQPFFENLLAQFFDAGQSDAKDIALTCMHGNGKALETLGLTSEIDNFKSIYDQFDKVKEYLPLDDPSGSIPPSVTISLQLWMVEAIKDGVILDSEKTVTQLLNLNKEVNKATASCSAMTPRDTWVINSLNCTTDMGTKWLTSSAPTFDIPAATCLGVNDWESTSTLATSRYTTTNYPDSCSNPTRDYIQKSVEGFKVHRDTIKTLFTNIQADLDNNVADKFSDFSAKIMEFVDDIKVIKDQMTVIEDALIGETNGIIPNVNCNFIQTDLNNLSQAMCYGFVATLYQTAIVLIVTSFMAFFSTIFVFCIAKKFSSSNSEKKGNDKVNPNYLT